MSENNIKYGSDAAIKAEIDEKMHQMAVIFANTGKDSTFKEMRQAYREENRLINEIAKIDLAFSKIIRPYKNE